MELKNNIINLFKGRQEADQLTSWKEEAEQNLKLLSQHIDPEVIVKDMKNYKAYNKEEAFEKITGEKFNKTRSLISFRSVAAAAVLLGVVSFFLLKFQSSDPDVSTVKYMAKDKEKNLLLSDQTEVLLAKGAILTNTSKREVELVGRAYFKVAKTSNKDRFIVNTSLGKVTVLGTRFSVSTLGNTIEVAVEEGRVLFEAMGKSTFLKAGDWVKSSGSEVTTGKISSSNQFSWVRHSLEFKDTPLDQAILDINKHFNVNIELGEDVRFRSPCLLTSKFSNESIVQLLDELKSLFQIQYRKNGDKYVITSIKC